MAAKLRRQDRSRGAAEPRAKLKAQDCTLGCRSCTQSRGDRDAAWWRLTGITGCAGSPVALPRVPVMI